MLFRCLKGYETSARDRTSNRLIPQHRRFTWDIRKNLVLTWIVKHSNSLPGEAVGCLSQADFEARLDNHLSGIVWVNPVLDRLDINWVLDKSMTKKLKCHFQSDLGTNNSGTARRVFINHCGIFRTFIHYSTSPNPTFKKSVWNGILTKCFSSKIWLTLKCFRASSIPLVQAMTELCPCPTPLVSDSSPANSVTGTVKTPFTL